MSKEEVCEKVKQMCEEAKIDFLFITENQSCWSIKKSSKHIRDVAKYHKENEQQYLNNTERNKGAAAVR